MPVHVTINCVIQPKIRGFRYSVYTVSKRIYLIFLINIQWGKTQIILQKVLKIVIT